MANSFQDIYIREDFKALSRQEQEDVRDAYFEQSVAPEAKSQGIDMDILKTEFDKKYDLRPSLMGVAGKALSDTHRKLSNTYNDIDRTTGVRNFSFRYDLGKRDTLEEKVAFLNEVLGPEGWVTGNQHSPLAPDFALTKKGMEALDMGDVWNKRTGKNKDKYIGIDESGLSFGDVGDFSQEFLPILAGVGTGVATAGLGVIPAMGLMGLAGATARGVDELGEHLQGRNKQSLGEVGIDMARTGAFEMLGEGLGRGIGVIGRKLFMGPNVMRKKKKGLGGLWDAMTGKRPEPRTAVDPERLKRVENMMSGDTPYAPLIAESTGLNPVAGVGQGIANIVAGGSPALNKNLKAFAADKDALIKRALGGEDLGGGFGKGIAKEVSQTVDAQKRALEKARNASTGSLSRMMANFRTNLGKMSGKGDSSTIIKENYNKFQKVSSDSYGQVDEIMGDLVSKPIVDAGNVHTVMRGMLEKRMGKAPGDQGRAMIDSILGGGRYISMKQAMFNAQRFKSAGFHEAMKGDFSQHEFRQIGEALEGAIETAGDQIKKVRGVGGKITPFAQRAKLREAAKAYDNARDFYRKNAWKFDDALVSRVTGQLRSVAKGADGEDIVVDNMRGIVNAMNTAGEGSIKKLYASMGDEKLVRSLQNEYLERHILKGTGRAGMPLDKGEKFGQEGALQLYQNIRNINKMDPDRLKTIFGKAQAKRLNNAAVDAEIYGRGLDDMNVSGGGGPATRMENIARESKKLDDLRKNEFVKIVEGGNPDMIAAKFEDLAGNIFEPTATNAALMRELNDVFLNTTQGRKLHKKMMGQAMEQLLSKAIKPGRNADELLADPKWLEGIVSKYEHKLGSRIMTKENPIISAFSKGGDLSQGVDMWRGIVEISKRAKMIGDKQVSSLVTHGFMFSPLANLRKLAGLRIVANLMAKPTFIKWMVRGLEPSKGTRAVTDSAVRSATLGFTSMMNDAIGDSNLGESFSEVYGEAIGQ